MRRLGILAALCVLAPASLVPSASAKDAWSLPPRLGLGVQADTDNDALNGWMEETRVPWDYATTWLGGGANTGSSWQAEAPRARYPLDYARAAARRKAIAVLTYAQIEESGGDCGDCETPKRVLSNLNNASTMASVFRDFTKLMQRLGPGTYDGVKGFGKTVIVHVEPNVSGYAQSATVHRSACFSFCTGEGNDPALLKAAVGNTGVDDLRGFPDTYAGASRAFVHLRDRYAPNVFLAYHVSPWGPFTDVGQDSDAALDTDEIALSAAEFAAASGVGDASPARGTYDLIFTDVADVDAAYLKYATTEGDLFWDRRNRAFPNFHRWERFVSGLHTGTDKPVVVWQIPVGNQVYRSMSNTTGHYQDNRAEYFLSHARDELAGAGVIGLIFGTGRAESTAFWDAAKDGVTNPAPVCTTDGDSSGERICPDVEATVADDDGGFLRTRGRAYYQEPVGVEAVTRTPGAGGIPLVWPLVVTGGLAAAGSAGLVLLLRRRRGTSRLRGPDRTPAATPTAFGGGRYLVRSFLGEGGMKRVYLVHDTVLDRDVAFALIRAEGLDQTVRERVRREAQSMARLGGHRNIVTVFDTGEEDGTPWMSCEYVSGGSVADLLRGSGTVSVERAVSIALDVARALEHAHGRGIVHRDVKAGNVWLAPDGTARVGDFGLAVALDRSRLTAEGTMLGTISSMPPEQIRGEPADARSDLYALGCLLYELLCGKPPFVGDGPAAVIGQHLHAAPDRPSRHNPSVPPALDDLVTRLLAKQPDHRPPSATAVREALERLAAAHPGGVPRPDEGSIEALAASVLERRPDVRSHGGDDDTVTMMFTDIESSTPLVEGLGDEAWLRVLRAHGEVVRAHVSEHGGRIVDSYGDGFMMTFRSARAAVRCAIAIQRAMEGVTGDVGSALRVRVGIHTGDVKQDEDKFFGIHVHLAARVGGLAQGGQILVSSVTRELVKGAEFAFGEARDVVLRGLSDRHRVYAVDWR